MHGRQKIRMVNAGTPRTYSQFVTTFRSTIQNSSTDTAKLLLTLCHYSRTFELTSAMNPDGVSYQGLATGAYCLLTEFQPFSSQNIPNNTLYEDSRALAVVRQAEAIQEAWVGIQQPAKRLEEAKLSLLRLIADNGHYQQEIVYKIANTLVLSGIKPFRALEVDTAEINNLFSKHLNVPAYDYYLVILAFWINSKHSPIFNLDNVLKRARRKPLIFSTANAAMSELSKTLDEYQSTTLNPKIERLSVNFRGSAYFSLHPMFRLGQNYFACLGHPFLRSHVTSKFVQKALALARIEQPNVNGKTKFSQFMGQRFEAYFKELCDEWNPPFGHAGEFIYADGMKSSDRLIFETIRGAPALTLVQLKLKTLPTPVHFAESWQEITKDFATSFADCIFKSIKFLYNLETKHAKGETDPNFKDMITKILSYKTYCLIGIVPDLPSIFSVSFARRALEAEVSKKVSRDKRLKAWVENKFKDGYLWHIMDLTEFQYILSTPPGTSLAEQVLDFVRNSGIDSDPLTDDDTFPPSFKNYLIEEFGSEASDRGKRLSDLNKRLLGIFDETKDDIKYFLFKSFLRRWMRVAFFGARELARSWKIWF